MAYPTYAHTFLCPYGYFTINVLQVPVAEGGSQQPSGIALEAGEVIGLNDSGQVCNSSLQSQTNKLLAILESRVAGVEATMAASFGRITDILAEMSHPKPSVGLRTNENIVNMQPLNANGDTQKEVAGGIAGVRTPSHPENQSASQSDVPAAGVEAPQRDMVSPEGSHSTSPTRHNRFKRVTTVGKRVTKVPRIRPLPAQARLAGARNPVSTEDTTQSDSIEVTTTPPARCNVPSGYINVTDSGSPTPTPSRVPILQPRKNNVSIYVPILTCECIFIVC